MTITISLMETRFGFAWAAYRRGSEGHELLWLSLHEAPCSVPARCLSYLERYWQGDVVLSDEWAPGFGKALQHWDGGLALPQGWRLAPQGTAFQRSVWQALGDIPAGQCVTYQSIAQKIGAERGFRAVGSAIGANPISLFIPCHRVIRSDGGLGGYAWGLEMKRRILEMEEGLKQAA